MDPVAGEYDAGVQLGEFIHRDMIAVRVTEEMRRGWVACFLRVDPYPASPTRSEGSLVHRLSIQQWSLPMGV